MVIRCDVAELARAIQTVLGDGAMADQMAGRGRELVSDCYTWDATAERLEDLYRTITIPPLVQSVKAAWTPR